MPLAITFYLNASNPSKSRNLPLVFPQPPRTSSRSRPCHLCPTSRPLTCGCPPAPCSSSPPCYSSAWSITSWTLSRSARTWLATPWRILPTWTRRRWGISLSLSLSLSGISFRTPMMSYHLILSFINNSLFSLTQSDDGRLNGYSHSRTRARSRSRSRMRSHSPGVPQYVVHRCTGKDIALYIDKFSRGFFPFAFFVLNISYWTTYGTM